jgi:uncharacterized protein (TIGR02265 family)
MQDFNKNNFNINPKNSLHFEDPSLMKPGERAVSGGTVRTLLEACDLKDHQNLYQSILNYFGFDPKNPPMTYSYNRYLEIAEQLRASLFSNKPVTAGYEEIGYRIGQNYFQGVSGQVLKMTARVLGPERGAKQFVRSISRALPWGTHEIVELRPHYVKYRKAGVGGPSGLMLGLLRACIEASGVTLTRAEYTIVSKVNDDVIYELEWL